MKLIAILLAALVLAVLAHPVTQADAPPSATRWDYKVILSLHPPYTEESKAFYASQGMEVVEATAFLAGLRAAGADGWELTSSMRWDPIGWLYYFKRPLP